MAQAVAFREWVTIYTPGETEDDGIGGRLAAEPDTSFETWADVKQYEAQRVLDFDGKFPIKQKYRFIIRYINAPNVQFIDRVEWNGTSITISSVVIDPRKTTITLHGYGD
jgi:hypothetical protein